MSKLVRLRRQEEEDARLVDAVRELGPANWSVIAKHVESRSAAQCNARWVHYKAPGLRFEPFSAAEDAHVLKGVQEFGRNWRRIAASMHNRSTASVKNRGQTLRSRALKALVTDDAAVSRPAPVRARSTQEISSTQRQTAAANGPPCGECGFVSPPITTSGLTSMTSSEPDEQLGDLLELLHVWFQA